MAWLRRQRVDAWVALPLAAAAAAVVLLATRWGPWAGSDSVAYIVTARTFLEGRGLGQFAASGRFMPLRLHPPLYPLALSAVAATGLEAAVAARWMDALLLGVTVGGVFLAALSLSDSRLLAAGLALLTLTSARVLVLFTGIMSEPLFIVTGLGSLAIVLGSCRPPPSRLVVAGLLGGACLLTRYVGVAFIATGAVVLLGRGERRLRQRALQAAIYTALGLAPTIVWLIYLSVTPGGAAPRALVLPVGDLWGMLAPYRVAVVETTWDWFRLGDALANVGYRTKLIVLAASTGLLAVAAWVVARRPEMKAEARARRPLPVARVAIVFLLIYLSAFALSYALADPPPPLTDRLLFPVPAALAIFDLACLWCLLSFRLGNRTASAMLGVSLSVLAALHATSGLNYGRRLWEEGEGYTGNRWRSSGTIAGVSSLHPNTPLISNDSAAIVFLTGRPAFDIPELQSAERVSDLSARFGAGASMADQRFREGGGALVLFDNAVWQLEAIYGEDKLRRLQGLTQGLVVYSDYPDGTIYLYPPAGAE